MNGYENLALHQKSLKALFHTPLQLQRAPQGLNLTVPFCFSSRRKKKCIRFLAGGADQDLSLSPPDNTGSLESENIDTNVDSNSPVMITTTNSTTPTS